MFALILCTTLACADFATSDYVLSRDACLQEMQGMLALKAGPRALCVSEGFGEVIDSAGQIKRGWQNGLSAR